jgi:hypothetical protein
MCRTIPKADECPVNRKLIDKANFPSKMAELRGFHVVFWPPANCSPVLREWHAGRG